MREVTCPECLGAGWLPDDELGSEMECEICGGSGLVESDDE